jgi:hypothetical protein
MKKLMYIGFLGCLVASLFNSCKEPYIVDITDSTVESYRKRTVSCEVGVDSLLPPNKSVFMVWTLVCDSDSVCQFMHSIVHAPNHPINVQFVPCTAFDKYKLEMEDTFAISPNMLNWIQPMEYCSANLPFVDKYDVTIGVRVVSEQNGEKHKWELLCDSYGPAKKFYYYDWESKMHYDYMRYNADSAVVTFSISNNLDIDTIAPLDSAWMCLSSTPEKKVYTQFPLEIKDTISIVRDTIYHFSLGGYMKGQKCGTDAYSIRVHKSEIISDQDQTHRHQSSIYEYENEGDD